MAVEFGRKLLTSINRPSFAELDDAVHAAQTSAVAIAPEAVPEARGPVAA